MAIKDELASIQDALIEISSKVGKVRMNTMTKQEQQEEWARIRASLFNVAELGGKHD